ncbi:MAG: FkbM family methyltransferase [Lachnospiraceae bacterium]|nr:FkbM family methyltransferase [Lachnospiraceae bacterium]
MSRLDSVLKWDSIVDIRKRLIDDCMRYDSIIIWGAGIGGATTADILQDNDLYERIICFVDNDPNKQGMLYKGKLVRALNDLESTDKQSIFIVSSTAFNIIVKQLVVAGVDKNNVVYFQPARLSVDDEDDREYIRNHIDDYGLAYDALCDDLSKRIFENLLNYKISRDVTYLENMIPDIDDEGVQYFDKQLISAGLLQDGFIDGGAYDGDTVISLYKHFPYYKGKVFCYEAEKDNYEKLQQRVSKMELENVVCINRAMWESDGELSIETSEVGGDAGSKVSSTGKSTIKCCALDSMTDKHQKIDFIKMDIEGAEKEALRGGRKLIEKYHPTLAICVYHKIEDLYEVWKIIETYTPGVYNFYLRQYRFGDSETVLYAIPKNENNIGREAI